MSSGREEEVVAIRFTKELNDMPGKPTNRGIVEVLNRIKNELVWTAALAQTESGQALELAIRTCATSPERWSDKELRDVVESVLYAHSAQLRDADIRETEARWWHTEPVPDGAECISLEFRDITAQHKSWLVPEAWPPQASECASSETFERAAQRFRVRANQKHRHPFMPLLSFDAVLKSGLVSFDALGERPITDVLNEFPEERVVEYVRNDENNALQSPARYFNIWERMLPSWCTTPDDWIEPIPPPGFTENPDDPPPSGEQYYKKVPTLHIPGSGRHIIPSAKKPDIISRAFYIPVADFGSNVTRIASLEREADLVPHDAHLVPGKDVTVDAACALLGRVVQHSTEPRPNSTAPPQGKRRKVNKFAAQKLGLAWGLETDSDGRPVWLLCLEFHGMGSEYAIDLSGENRLYGDLRSPIAVRTVECAWVGAAVLPADTKAMQGAGKKAEPEASTEADKQVLSYDDWYKRTKKWIRALNKKKAPLLEVGAYGAFVGGDLGTSKGDDDEFEAEVTGAKSGVWLASVTAAEPQEGGDNMLGYEPQLIRFVWIRDGTVDYNALPSRASVQAPAASEPDADWEVVASFSVDSGTICLFSKHALESLLATGTDREAMLEIFFDDDGDGTNVFVPSGVVLSGSDGGYEIKARRDGERHIVELTLRV